MPSIEAWTGWCCPAICCSWPWVTSSTRAWSKWRFRRSYKTWRWLMVDAFKYVWYFISMYCRMNPKRLKVLPGGLKPATRTFGYHFNQSLENVTLPSSIKSIFFGRDFNQSLLNVIWPTELQSLTLGDKFNQSLEQVKFPEGLESLEFGRDFNHSLERVHLPSDLQRLTFGYYFDHNLEEVSLPGKLKSLTFGDRFNRSLEKVHFPVSLERLTLGQKFNQSLELVKLPALKELTLGLNVNSNFVKCSAQLQKLICNGLLVSSLCNWCFIFGYFGCLKLEVFRASVHSHRSTGRPSAIPEIFTRDVRDSEPGTLRTAP